MLRISNRAAACASLDTRPSGGLPRLDRFEVRRQPLTKTGEMINGGGTGNKLEQAVVYIGGGEVDRWAGLTQPTPG